MLGQNVKRTKPKIIIVSNLARSLVIFWGYLLLELKLSGLDVIACAPDEDPWVLGKLSKWGISFAKIKMDSTGLNPLNDIITLGCLFFLFKKHKPDIVLSYTIKPLIYGSIAAYFAGVAKIVPINTGLGFVFIGTSMRHKILAFFIKRMFRFVFKRSKVVLFQNSDILHLFVAAKLIDRKKTALINGTGVNLEHFMVRTLPATLTFLMIARLLKDKGLLEYFAAAKIIKNKYPWVGFKLVGYIDRNPSAIAHTELDQLLADGHVEFLGKLDDVRDVIAASSVYVLPSYCEGMPNTILEAMSMGRPIVTTNAPGCRESIIDGVNGYLVPVKSVEKLAAAMEKFILCPELVSQMGDASRKNAEDKYDVRKVNKVILRAIGVS